MTTHSIQRREHAYPTLEDKVASYRPSQEKRRLDVLIVCDEAYSTMGEVGKNFFRKYKDKDYIFEPRYISKQNAQVALEREESEKLKADLTIFNLVCNEKPLSDENKFGLLKRFIEINPDGIFITPVNTRQYIQVMEGGECHEEWVEFAKALSAPTSLRPYRIPSESLKKDDPKGFLQYFRWLMDEYSLEISTHFGYGVEQTLTTGLPAPKITGKEITDAQIRELSNILPAIEKDFPIGVYSNIRIGGIGKVVIHPGSLQEYQDGIKFLLNNDLQYSVIGKGTNTIFGNLHGVLIITNNLNSILSAQIRDKIYDLSAFKGNLLENKLKEILEGVDYGEDFLLEVEAGLPSQRLSHFGKKHGLSGAEYLIGIPGTVGGISVMNASVGTNETKGIVEEITILNQNGELESLNNDQLDYGYRYSQLQGTGDAVYSVRLRLKRGNIRNIGQITDRYNLLRKDEPKYPSVGSMILRRGIKSVNGGEHNVEFYVEDILEPECLGLASDSNFVRIPEKGRYSSWMITGKNGISVNTRSRRRSISPATLYDIADLAYRIGDIALAGGYYLHWEVKFAGVDNSKEPLHPLMQSMLVCEIEPQEVKKQLLIGGQYSLG